MGGIVAFAGSVRRGSWNRKLVRIAAEGASDAGADVELLELVDYPMPLMNEDLEAEKGMPEAAARFKDKLREAQGFIVSAPEYNSSITPLLKNCLDWASRSQSPDEKPLSAFRGKFAVLMSASPGSAGGNEGACHPADDAWRAGCNGNPGLQVHSTGGPSLLRGRFAEKNRRSEGRKKTGRGPCGNPGETKKLA